MATTFPCYKVTKDEDGQALADVAQASLDELPPGDVVIRVAYSSLNYKDALGATGHPGVVRNFPHVPGIDAAGTVTQSSSDRFGVGDEVLVTGFDLGQNAWGGYAEYVRVPADWIVPLPQGLSLRDSMIYGTAGFTAALSVEALLAHGVRPDKGEVIVTGASGGVGCLAVGILARLGYQVVASTGKSEAHDFLRELGAASIVGRDEVDERSNRPLLKGRWAGAVDTVGGHTLSTLLRSTKLAACVAACGLVGGTELPITVYPFILRGVVLAGIDSATYPIERRANLWQKLADEWRPPKLESCVATTVDLHGLGEQVARILSGGVRGRVLVTPTA